MGEVVKAPLTGKKILGGLAGLGLQPAQDFFRPVRCTKKGYPAGQRCARCHEGRMTTPPLPADVRLESLEVGATPLVGHFLDRLDLAGLLQRHLPPLPGRAPAVSSATALALLVHNFLLARR